MPRFTVRGLAASTWPILAGLILVVGLFLLPDFTPKDAIPAVGQQTDKARIIADAGRDPTTGLPLFEVEIVETGERVEAVVQDASGALPGSGNPTSYEVGDEVAVTRFSGPAGQDTFAVVSEPWRISTLGWLALLFAVAVVIVGGWKGARSLIALAFTLAFVVKVVVPLLLSGVNPVLLAVVGAAIVTTATLLLTDGANRVTASALLGTLAALAITGLLAAAFTGAAQFTQLQGNEEIAYLIPLVGDRIDLQGILLAATVFGALGVLDDVTVTQAATVDQLHRSRPDVGRGAVLRRAMIVGRSHIAATVNTLVLAYLGAGLPLLLLFALSQQAPLTIVNSEVVAVEVIRALVGSIGIVAAVPLTTLVASWLVVPRPDAVSAAA